MQKNCAFYTAEYKEAKRKALGRPELQSQDMHGKRLIATVSGIAGEQRIASRQKMVQYEFSRKNTKNS